MRVTVHRTQVKLLHRCREMQSQWSEYRFSASEASWRELPSWAEEVRSASEPIEIEAPIGSRLERFECRCDPPPPVLPEPLRLVTHYDRSGIDAAAVYGLASKGARGFRLASAGEACIPASITLAPAEKACFPASPAHASSAPPVVRWGIAFTTGPLGRRSWLAQFSTEGGPIAGIRDMARVARWSDHADAEEWFRANGLQVGQLVSPGLDWVYPSIELIPDDETPRGCEFQINSRPSVQVGPHATQAEPEPPPATPKPTKRPRRQRAGQAVFAFAEVDL